MPAAYHLLFLQACLLLTGLEVVHAIVVASLAELGVGSPAMKESVHKEGWYLMAYLLTDMLRGFVCHSLLFKVRHSVLEHAEQPSTSAMWWCLVLACGMGQWSVLLSLEWHDDVASAWSLRTWAVLNLLTCVGWASLLTFYKKKGVLPEPDIFTYQQGSERRMPYGVSCLVCLVDVEVGEAVAQLQCGHAFHQVCIEGWFAVQRRCPMRCQLEAGQSEPQEELPAGSGAGEPLEGSRWHSWQESMPDFLQPERQEDPAPPEADGAAAAGADARPGESLGEPEAVALEYGPEPPATLVRLRAPSATPGPLTAL